MSPWLPVAVVIFIAGLSLYCGAAMAADSFTPWRKRR